MDYDYSSNQEMELDCLSTPFKGDELDIFHDLYDNEMMDYSEYYTE